MNFDYNKWQNNFAILKKNIRYILYGNILSPALCFIVYLYLHFVFFTSRKKFIGLDQTIEYARRDQAMFFTFWHNRLFMIPFLAKFVSKKSPNYQFANISSRHGDGRYIGIIMTLFGFKNISGSTRAGRKKSKGITYSSMRDIIRVLKNGYGFGIAPDGPTGPAQKINGQLLEMAALTSAYIVPVSYSTSRYIAVNSWDKLRIPLPFSKIIFYCDEIIKVNNQDAKSPDFKEKVEQVLDRSQDSADNELKKYD